MNYEQIAKLETLLNLYESQLNERGDVREAWLVRENLKLVRAEYQKIIPAQRSADSVVKRIQSEL
jgi:hypothetical protein